MIWGMCSGGWMAGLTDAAHDKYRARLELLAEHDLHCTSWPANELMALEPARREEIAGWLADYDVHVGLGVGVPFLSEDDDAVRRATDAAVQAVAALARPFRALVCTTGIDRRYHHYSHDLPLERQLDRLSRTMAPLARACADLGCPLVVHTVAHWGEDMAQLCQRVPGLAIQLDTANCFLIGEPPLVAARACAPYTLATHFKDHRVAPSFDPLGLRAEGAVPGQGDCSLREICRILLENAPNPDRLAMELEIDPVRDEHGELRDRREVLQEAVQFLRSL